MAIKISGTTVVDDSRNLVNLNSGAIVGVQSGGNVVGAGATTLNFIGAGNTFYYNAGTKTLDVSIQGGGGIGIQSAGSQIGTGVTQLNFIGAGNTFRVDGGTVDISISGGGGGGGGVSTTGILSCRAIANSALIFESIELGDSFAQGTNYAMIGPITVVGGGTTVTVGAGVSYVIV